MFRVHSFILLVLLYSCTTLTPSIKNDRLKLFALHQQTKGIKADVLYYLANIYCAECAFEKLDQRLIFFKNTSSSIASLSNMESKILARPVITKSISYIKKLQAVIIKEEKEDVKELFLDEWATVLADFIKLEKHLMLNSSN